MVCYGAPVHMLPLLALIPLATAAEVTCPAPSSAVDSALSAAEKAYAGLDEDGFFAAASQASTLLGCVSEPISPTLAARFHRVQGIAAFARKDRETAVLDFGAARAADPDYTFPETLVPPGNKMLQDYVALDLSLVTRTRVPAPATGALTFDGRTSLERPELVPTIAQFLDSDGRPTLTIWLRPNDPMPVYTPRTTQKKSGKGRTLAGVGLQVAGVGLAAWGSNAFYAAQCGAERYANQLTPEELAVYEEEELKPLRLTGLGLMAAGGVGLIAGGALLVVHPTGASVTVVW